MDGSKNIILIGMMGAGKTEVGLALACRLGRSFLDCDKIYRERYGSIDETFITEGEAAFRARENEILFDLSNKSGSVIATGGGAVLSLNFSLLKDSGIVIYLSAPVTVLHERIKKSEPRPLATSLERMEKIFKSREQLYLKSASLTIDTESKTIDEVIEAILLELRFS